MNLAQLRNALEPLVIGLKDAGSHTVLPSLCEELGLPPPDHDESKRERMVWFASTILAGRRQLSWPVKRGIVNPSLLSV
jgi:hypothetical protein